MTIDDARSLLAYDEWANARFLTAVAALGEELFTRRIESSFPSIRDTLAHVVSAEWVWLEISHVVNHSTYHRGQLAAMRRQAGSHPPSTDYSIFLAERSPG